MHALSRALIGMALLLGSLTAFGQGATPPPASGAALAEPLWPLGYMLPANLGGKPPTVPPAKADILVWVPEGATRVRAAFLVPNNSDSKDFAQCDALRKVAAKHELGIIYMRNYDTGIEWGAAVTPDLTRIPALLNFVADETKIAEFRHAPLISFGKSSRGSFPYRVGWFFPTRTIASLTYHGETPSWPLPASAKLNGETVLELNVNGETEWGGTWFVHVRPSLLNYRANTAWLAHQAVSWGVGHGDYPDETSGKSNPTPRQWRVPVWEYMALFLDKAMALRVPDGQYATDGPVALKQVDEAGGYLIDPFAVEEMFRVPHNPLPKGPGGYIAGGAEPTVTGYAAIPPANDYVVPDGVPVVVPAVGKSPSNWLISAPMHAAMKRDPITDLGELAALRPKPGDTVTIDGTALAFKLIDPKQVPKNGGVSLGGLKRSGKDFTFFAYTVLDVPAARCYKVRAPFTPGGRLQVVLNGVPVAHGEVVDLPAGRCPMLVVLRLAGVSWGAIEPLLEDVTPAEIEQGKGMAAENARRKAEWEKMRTAPPKDPWTLIRKATDVPKDQRAGMLWIADRELAEAWIKLHTVPRP
jgi:hypothetical protein